MVQTIEGVLEVDGSVRLLQPIQPSSSRRALVMILDEPSERSFHLERGFAGGRLESSRGGLGMGVPTAEWGGTACFKLCAQHRKPRR